MKINKDNIQSMFDTLKWEEREQYKELLPPKFLNEMECDSRNWSKGDVLMDGDGKYFIIK